ncbi:thiol-disulfide isomerase/thioredoxin [Paraburkholderia bryophila]|uniref:Thiol-disulfide isomerase/thioredoxin n=2 Tax=Paraburkholderia bryophila TaxID=420952 RepID=A0A329BNJ9_9BURK|nr:thiol-disulfide isomerase/thioredoxin [Paraburkholderia bryophila]
MGTEDLTDGNVKRYYPLPAGALPHHANGATIATLNSPGPQAQTGALSRAFRATLEVPFMSSTPSTASKRANPLRYVIIAVVAVAIAVAGYFAFAGQQRVPDATFTLLSGQKVSTADLKGKVYLVNFWATSCDTCMKEMPQMVQTYNRFKGKGLEFVAVAMNYDAPMYVTNYSQTRQLPFKVAMDDGSAARQFGNVQLTPTTFLVDKDGKILKRYVGEPQFAELDKLLEKALNAA